MNIDQKIVDYIINLGAIGKNKKQIANELNITINELNTERKRNKILRDALEAAEINRRQFNLMEEEKNCINSANSNPEIKNKKTAVKKIQDYFSTVQTELDKITFDYLKLKEAKEQQRKFDILNDFVDFNASITMPLIVPLIINMKTVNFVLKNNSDLKRKFTFIELVDLNSMLKLIHLFKMNPANIEEFKIMYAKIKPCSKTKTA